MTQRERQLLQWIKENPLISQQELAEKAGITRSSVAVHISNLTKKGYIQGKGYIVQTQPYAVVAGAVNIDICGRPLSKLKERDSNPGLVHTSLGGAGRNIAHNMSLLGLDVKMLTAFGDDVYAQKIISSCKELNIDIHHALAVQGELSSTYLFITGEEGDMRLAVSDMEICKLLTPSYFESRLDLIRGARVCVVDANLPQESLEYLAANSTAPIFADPVSATKARRLELILNRIHTIKPNRYETEVLTGVAVDGEDSLRKAAERFLARGVKRVFISLDEDGVFCADENRYLHLPSKVTKMINTTGAGDTFMGAIAWAHMYGLDLEKTAEAGIAAAAICMESKETINEELNVERLLEELSWDNASLGKNEKIIV